VVRLDGVRGFGLGYRIPALNRDVRSKLGVTPAVAAAVEEVHRRAAAAYYAVYRDRDVVIAYVADSSEAPRVDPLDVGFHQAAHALAKVMLASLPPAARREYLRERGLPVFTERTTTEGARLERDLARVATIGLGADVEEFQPGLACVTAPVVGIDGAVSGAVSVSVPVATLVEDRPPPGGGRPRWCGSDLAGPRRRQLSRPFALAAGRWLTGGPGRGRQLPSRPSAQVSGATHAVIMTIPLPPSSTACRPSVIRPPPPLES